MRIHASVVAAASLALAVAACGGATAVSSSAVTAHGPIRIWYSNNAQEIVWGKQVVAAWNSSHPTERSIALPLVRPALLTAMLLTFIGPWNEFLWPFLVTKQQALEPLAVALANYISTVAAAATNPNGAILAGACVLALPVVVLFIAFQRHFRPAELGSGVKG